MRIGMIATEFPPRRGGIQELSGRLASALAVTDEVHVHTLPGRGLEDAGCAVINSLSGDLWRDARALLAHEPGVDAWLATNGGLTPLAAELERPFFCYMHGNDFLDPWLACGPRWLEVLRRPYAAKIRHTLRRRAIRRCLSDLRHVLTNSHQTATLVHRRLGVSEDGVSIVHPGVADAFFQEQEPGGGDALRLLTVARLSPHTRRKNVDGVLHALRLLGEAVPISYTVVGDGADRPSLEALAHELGLADRVDFLGEVEFERLLAAYRQADVFVLASKATERDVEGFGMVFVEASACGVPVICSREGGATDAVVEGRNGLLIERSTPEAIADGIRRFVRERQRFLPETVRAFAEEFRWAKVAARVRRLLGEHLT